MDNNAVINSIPREGMLEQAASAFFASTEQEERVKSPGVSRNHGNFDCRLQTFTAQETLTGVKG